MKLSTLIKTSDSETKQLTMTVFTKNICSEGAFLEKVLPLPTGSKVLLHVSLPMKKKGPGGKDSLIKFSGTVLRHDPTGTAVKLNPEYKIIPLEEFSSELISRRRHDLGV